MSSYTIFICGGHYAPAIAVIEKLQKEVAGLRLIYIGRRFSFEGDNSLSIEYRHLRDSPITFLPIISGRLSRIVSLSSALSLLKIPFGFLQSLFYIIKYRPVLVVSFGGYIALPVAVAAKITAVPVITHEQTKVLGLTNRIISRFARLTCLTYGSTEKVPRSAKTEVTGLPLRESIIKPRPSSITGFGDPRKPLIYITGGSAGSSSINKVVLNSLPELLKNYRLLHVTGTADDCFYYKRLSQYRSRLETKQRENYKLLDYLDYKNVGDVLKKARLVISRSGANSIAELLYFGKYAILIPLPWAGDYEQQKNAQILKEAGLAVVIDQNDFNNTTLLEAVRKIEKFKKKTVTPKNSSGLELQAASVLTGKIMELIGF
ncbi:hypothetical protein A3D05_05050 [Candidatus Gottesmanbacteria bacterium RIFCSPHIGHO2_02_FULL_40_24]|uniref:UDP-N-acetylglucosamine--N-acetylmuramyl-(pentapeptide) pyrophosphoryl-undecaprenol N-acetylglucosamine transferase n=1 Tax=Candidatus Gottesmanbacteria bacterium RIFCSPHIGHO2_01_FULL_40_15 TaxID=1798376 RepID=A0A1F5Z235_9BACT|nr:MAG: hypothetical protein A2777_06080 [Candidatus Gottesmanbacteria bacterium RIFCSPHIGHO2_01_FULL_40_15]OGG16237.1 MAG: hypothetical protein A3D05_05050 [Candidatus Gottesmanbacteria bacterium RIFCSPHIGHO2_02_FULL_40_24]OGG23229.1 MAG: hypothetical protein A3B48_00430 [Candidatus Gottesmanbacteria bacterium RIFCSPLOWO2_01_FULL_40_10]OGG33767.1 MAG: hypothetical protein A3I80_06530 [Candidatus Gottesmanbacteria bacterium RIFCSPLOWO2_02_FULL_40_10]